jgi:hypothetical protein
MQLTLMGAKSKASCCVRPGVAAPIVASIIQPPAIGFSQIDPVMSVMNDERSFVTYRAPILAVSIAANVRLWKVFCIFSNLISSRGTVWQPLTSHEDGIIDGAHLFKQLFQVRLDLLTAEVAGVTEDATFGKRVVGEDGLDAFVDFCFAG